MFSVTPVRLKCCGRRSRKRLSATCSGIDPPNPPILISNWQQMISEPWHSMCLEWRCCHERLARSRSHRRRRLPGKLAVPAGKRTDLSLVPSHLRRCCPPAYGGGPDTARGLANQEELGGGKGGVRQGRSRWGR